MRKDKIANEIRQQIENSKAISNKLQNPSNTIQNNEVLPENVANSFPPLNDNLTNSKSNETAVQNNNPTASSIPSNRNYSSAVTNINSRPSRIEHLIKMRIIPPFTKEHLSSPVMFDQAVKSCYVAILKNFSPSSRLFVTISKTHTNIGNRKLQTLMVTAPIEAEDEVNALQLNGLEILNRTIFPTADEVWRYSPSMYPKKYTVKIEGLPILCGDEELEEVLAMPVGQLIFPITRHTANTELGTVFTGTAHGTVQIGNTEDEEILRKWSKQNGITEVPNWHGLHIRAHVPRLHTCENCSHLAQRVIIGHDDAWCRKKRAPIQIIEEEPGENENEPNKTPPEDNEEKTQKNRKDAQPTTDQLEDGEVPDDSNWYESSTRTFNPNNKKRGQNFEATPNSTPQKNKFQAFSEELNAPSPEVSPRSRSPNQQPLKQLIFNND